MPPIRPEQVSAKSSELIPEAVFDCFNDLIAMNFCDGSAVVRQKDVVARMVRHGKLRRKDIFDKGWLNVEAAYRQAGWKVEYDRPGYNEDYEAFFRFSHKRKS